MGRAPRVLCLSVLLALLPWLGLGSARVVSLTTANFDASVASGFWLLEFFAPWCGHCRELDPVLRQSSVSLGAMGIHVGQIDATAESALRKRFNVTGYPTLFTFRGGVAKAYSGGRTQQAIIDYCIRASRPPVQDVSSIQLDTFLRSYSPIAFLFLRLEDSTRARALEKSFREAATEFSMVLDMGVSADKEIIRGFHTEQHRFYALARFNKGKLSELVSQPSSVEEFTSYIRANQFGSMTKLNSHNFVDFVKQKKLAVLAAVPPEPNVKSRQVLSLLERLEQNPKYTDKFAFCQMDGVTWSHFLDRFNVDEHSLPKVVVLDGAKNTFYEDPEVDEVSEVQTFIDRILSGDISPQRLDLWGLPSRLVRMAKDNYPISIFIIVGVAFVLIIILIIVIDGLCSKDEAGQEAKEPETGASASASAEEEEDKAVDEEPSSGSEGSPLGEELAVEEASVGSKAVGADSTSAAGKLKRE